MTPSLNELTGTATAVCNVPDPSDVSVFPTQVQPLHN
jgi:hypothetical protein